MHAIMNKKNQGAILADYETHSLNLSSCNNLSTEVQLPTPIQPAP